MNLDIQTLENIEAPDVSTTEAILIGIIAIETGILIGLAIT